MEKFKSILKSIGSILLELLLRFLFVFRDLGIAIYHGVVSIVKSAIKFHKRFVAGNVWTKLSHFVMGIGNFAHKQFVKGAIFLFIQIIFIVFMVTSPQVNNTPLGAKSIKSFFTLGSEHGMPLTDMSDEVLESFDALIEYPGDLASATYESQRKLIVRGYNVISEYEQGNAKIKVEENNTESYKNYQQVIYDDRYGTNDCYGYGHFEGDETIELTKGSDVLWVSSSTEISNWENVFRTTKKALSEDPDTEDIDATIGIYQFNNNENGYLYFILVTINARKGYFTFTDSSVISTVDDCYRISIDTNLVNSNVDNSFLMMLFGIITFLFIGLYLVAWNLSIASSYKAEEDVKNGEKPSTFIQDCKSLLDGRFHLTLLTPAIILLLIFTIVPTVLMILISFTDMNTNAQISGAVLMDWVGLQNFIDLFVGGSGSEISREVGRNFFPVLTWTFEWAIIATFSCYFGGIFLALLINRKDVKLKKLWRTVFVLTIAIPQFITLLVIRNLLGQYGPINEILRNLGVLGDDPQAFVDFLGLQAKGSDMKAVWLVRATVLVVNLYVGIPHTMLMTSGILMNIPSDLYEAATIDGANKWQMFRKITLPYVIFVTTPYLISSFIGNITSFNIIFLLTGGGPATTSDSIAGSTDLLVTWLYKMTIDNYKYNAGSIIGILTFFITAFITLFCYRNSKAYKEEDTFQ